MTGAYWTPGTTGTPRSTVPGDGSDVDDVNAVM
jgi:hypothetical protein